MRPDRHAQNGSYSIRSLYFDDINDRFYYENENGNDPRSKYRIRIYNADTGYIRLEKKSKRADITIKESCLLSPDECSALMRGDHAAISVRDDDIKQRLLKEMELMQLLPVIIVSYERTPFVYPAGNVRLTIDGSLCYSTDIASFLDEKVGCIRPVMIDEEAVMELKWDDVLPEHILSFMDLGSLRRGPFSKYYISRRQSYGYL